MYDVAETAFVSLDRPAEDEMNLDPSISNQTY
jgi:hypothetical protein